MKFWIDTPSSMRLPCARGRPGRYAPGIHPLYVKQAHEEDLAWLDEQLTQYRDDPRLVAAREIGLDYFMPELAGGPFRERQEFFYREQLRLARQHDLPACICFNGTIY